MSKTETVKLSRAEHLQNQQREAQAVYLASVSAEANDEPIDNAALDRAMVRLGLNEQTFRQDVQAVQHAKMQADAMLPQSQIAEMRQQTTELDVKLRAEMCERLSTAMQNLDAATLYQMAGSVVGQSDASNAMLEDWRTRLQMNAEPPGGLEAGNVRAKQSLAVLREQSPRVAELIRDIEAAAAK